MSKACILLVDDNPTNMKLATDLLGWEGYEVIKAADAAAAVAAIARRIPDLILMDIGLPDMDGLTLTRTLRSANATKRITIIALTSLAMRGDEERALAAGCDGYVTKPIDTRTLPMELAKWLQQPQPA